MIMGGSSKNYKVLKKGMGSTGADLNSSLFHGSGTKNINFNQKIVVIVVSVMT